MYIIDNLQNVLKCYTRFIISDDERSFSEPPGLLLELVTYWVSEYPALCSTALVSNLLPALPHGAIPMPAITPFVGLFKYSNKNFRMYR